MEKTNNNTKAHATRKLQDMVFLLVVLGCYLILL
jgi:hypothetical protein